MYVIRPPLLLLHDLSPGWCALHGKDERGRAVMQRINGRIPGYNVDFHWDIIKRTCEHEAEVALQLHGPSTGFLSDIWKAREIFVGVNGVSGTI